MVAVLVLNPYLALVANASPPGVPASIQVAVGYADTERNDTCSNCFPSPWCGSPGVQFIGSSTNYNGDPTDTGNCKAGDWDSGAVLVTNAGASPITLTGLTVSLPLPLSGGAGSPTCGAETRPITFDVWFGQQYYYGNHSEPAYLGGPITVPAGGQAIFAGTTSDGTYRCPSGNYPSGPSGGTYDFDTSDAYFLSGCAPTTDTASAPQVTISATGYAATTYVDNGHVIDTGGIDTGNCSKTAANPEWPNESLGWRLVSGVCGEACPTNQIGVSVPSSSSSSSSSSSTGSTTAVSATSSATEAVTTGPATGVSPGATTGALYPLAAVALVVLVIGYFALRRRRRTPS